MLDTAALCVGVARQTPSILQWAATFRHHEPIVATAGIAVQHDSETMPPPQPPQPNFEDRRALAEIDITDVILPLHLHQRHVKGHLPGEGFRPMIKATDVAEIVCANSCLRHSKIDGLDDSIWDHDGKCDDGGSGSTFDVCEFGTDCDDCGPRGSTPSKLAELPQPQPGEVQDKPQPQAAAQPQNEPPAQDEGQPQPQKRPQPQTQPQPEAAPPSQGDSSSDPWSNPSSPAPPRLPEIVDEDDVSDHWRTPVWWTVIMVTFALLVVVVCNAHEFISKPKTRDQARLSARV